MWWNLYRERNSQKSLSDMKNKMINYIKKIADCNISSTEWKRIVNELNLESFERNLKGNSTNNLFLHRSNLLQVWVQTKGYGHATIPKLQECFEKVNIRIKLPERDAQRSIHKAYEKLLSKQWDLIFFNHKNLTEEQKHLILNDLVQNEGS
uniref:Death domain-containing protein n=1 Tax=Ciona savignyi TaxID=51511 RepID=H2ZNB4_CIOSA